MESSNGFASATPTIVHDHFDHAASSQGHHTREKQYGGHLQKLCLHGRTGQSTLRAIFRDRTEPPIVNVSDTPTMMLMFVGSQHVRTCRSRCSCPLSGCDVDMSEKSHILPPQDSCDPIRLGSRWPPAYAASSAV
ncbi:hypothetical protein ZHAS_00004926 [Anopheles sinensis]|uniref:Uncharacterized protein n=1 Tax=Anopheles sinensis TaxID=74873 RepID=A0A084VI84_ANOSI|nr:hypothetical protein ZHAS_00004926 [Anopheles sinensis]